MKELNSCLRQFTRPGIEWEIAAKAMLNTLFADYSVLKFKTETEVEECPELDQEAKDICINELRSGNSEVWVIGDTVPWEH